VLRRPENSADDKSKQHLLQMTRGRQAICVAPKCAAKTCSTVWDIQAVGTKCRPHCL
jgi:hypothetical protein